MQAMIPQMVENCNDYFLNTIPIFPLNSTHMRFSFGQNRVTERKEALLRTSSGGRQRGRPDGENNMSHAKEKIRQKYPYRSRTYQNYGVHSDHWYITAHKKE